MFLVDKLPRMTSGAGDETSDGSGTVHTLSLLSHKNGLWEFVIVFVS